MSTTIIARGGDAALADAEAYPPQAPPDDARARPPIAVSVVVPTRGRGELLQRCLAALTTQDLPGLRYEIVVVDDSPFGTSRASVERWGDRLTGDWVRLLYVDNPGPRGPAAARNRGWRHARAPIIAFTDDDTVPSARWLAAGLAAFDPTLHALRGRVSMPLPPAPTDDQLDASELATAEFVTANCFCRKSVLELLGGFDERFRLAWRADSDLHFSLLELDAHIGYAPEALVVHPLRPAPWGVSLPRTRKIFFDALLYKKHPQLYRQRIGAIARWDYYAIVAALLAAGAGVALGTAAAALAAGAMWLLLTARLCRARLRGTSKSPSHVSEMIVTSALIPPTAVFWRLLGALRFRVRFV